nr:MAG TPA: hypothetical protein [Caudoviricetes sp.]
MASDRAEFLQDVSPGDMMVKYDGMAANGLPCFCG